MTRERLLFIAAALFLVAQAVGALDRPPLPEIGEAKIINREIFQRDDPMDILSKYRHGADHYLAGPRNPFFVRGSKPVAAIRQPGRPIVPPPPEEWKGPPVHEGPRVVEVRPPRGKTDPVPFHFVGHRTIAEEEAIVFLMDKRSRKTSEFKVGDPLPDSDLVLRQVLMTGVVVENTKTRQKYRSKDDGQRWEKVK